MSLLYKLEYQDNFTDLEKGIANYILDHKDYIVDLKIIDLAEITPRIRHGTQNRI